MLCESIESAHTSRSPSVAFFVLDLELCTRNKRLVLDLKLSLVRRFVSLIQRPLMVCNWPWFGRTGTAIQNWRQAFCTIVLSLVQ